MSAAPFYTKEAGQIKQVGCCSKIQAPRQGSAEMAKYQDVPRHKCLGAETKEVEICWLMLGMKLNGSNSGMNKPRPRDKDMHLYSDVKNDIDAHTHHQQDLNRTNHSCNLHSLTVSTLEGEKVRSRPPFNSCRRSYIAPITSFRDL
ncbi:uncharacterized protein RCO7_14331 [Rhynchosporium graminicola]|uniref:Uncharacterized protein n=1 Tax=Rhynchosporium graminicola TaxID=2792576 RepID=A0A1E1K9V0_9HELO|nr:uncharacterized protein RCO7_14331 [Rhynchosporium commune]